MLVLSRGEGESVTIRTASGETIVVALLEIAGTKAKVGFEAPRSCAIARSELQPLPQVEP